MLLCIEYGDERNYKSSWLSGVLQLGVVFWI